MAWKELLKEQQVDSAIFREIDKMLIDWKPIAQRFSKIWLYSGICRRKFGGDFVRFSFISSNAISSQITIKLNIPDNPNIIYTYE
jgi:hypothetical protein